MIRNHNIFLKDTSEAEMARFRQIMLGIWRQQIEDDKNVLNNDIHDLNKENDYKHDTLKSNLADNVKDQSVDTIVNLRGYFYTKTGKYLGKIGGDDLNDNVYITDEITFLEIEKVKTVSKDMITYSANRYNLDNNPFILEIEKRKNEIIYFTEKYKLTNTQLLDRANWIYAEGGYKIPEFVAYTIENAYNDSDIAKKDENKLYYYLMQDASGRLEKDKYFSGGYKNQTGKRFWKVRGTISMDKDMMNTIAAVIKSKLYPEKDPTGGTNSWLGYPNGSHEGEYFIKTEGSRFFFQKRIRGKALKTTSKERKYITID
ncbi:hypothetical protein [Flavobacterium hungaricum]|uniref:Uncharacterized protein n=1 Tax=Flavobacterium hungaricum TaxID=2082725 RepID=A0ABR9TLB3_9FLAO|nr:hypothetical protein [Flavobacterium hungaricum]MBE8725802.1 hypothetical protein [Flavobacterium hungaricum]